MTIQLPTEPEPRPLSRDVEQPPLVDFYWARRRDGWSDGRWYVVPVLAMKDGRLFIVGDALGSGLAWDDDPRVYCDDPRVQMGRRIPQPKRLEGLEFLARCSPMITCSKNGETRAECLYCGAVEKHAPCFINERGQGAPVYIGTVASMEHKPDCPWLRAQEKPRG